MVLDRGADPLVECRYPRVQDLLGVGLQDMAPKQRGQGSRREREETRRKSSHFVGEMTSKQNLRSESLTGRTVQIRRSSSITVGVSSESRFLLKIGIFLYEKKLMIGTTDE